MSFPRVDDADLRALQALSREAADLPVPALNWDRIERNLFATVEKPVAVVTRGVREHAVAAPSRRAASPWAIALAAAAAVAIVGAGHHASLPRSMRESHGDSLQMPNDQVAAFRVGDAIESGEREMRLHQDRIADLVLAPRSRLEVTALQVGGELPSMTVTLVLGSIHAEVVPHARGEVFAVEVGRTRVAVHGTAFTVSKEGDRVGVEVSHGSVAVGPTGHPGSTQGWLLVGPERGSFSLDGGLDARWLEPSTVATRESPMPPRPVASALPAVGSKTAARLAALAAQRSTSHESSEPSAEQKLSELKTDKLSRADQEHLVTRAILAGLDACYERQASSSGVRFSVESSLALMILPSGVVREGVFNPPLSPTLMTCAGEAVGKARFPEGEARQISVPVRLSRP